MLVQQSRTVYFRTNLTLFFTIQHYTFRSTIDFNLTKFYKNAALVKEVHTQKSNPCVVTVIKLGLSSLLTFNIDSLALISTNFLLSVGLLDNYGANPYVRLS